MIANASEALTLLCPKSLYSPGVGGSGTSDTHRLLYNAHSFGTGHGICADAQVLIGVIVAGVTGCEQMFERYEVLLPGRERTPKDATPSETDDCVTSASSQDRKQQPNRAERGHDGRSENHFLVIPNPYRVYPGRSELAEAHNGPVSSTQSWGRLRAAWTLGPLGNFS